MVENHRNAIKELIRTQNGCKEASTLAPPSWCKSINYSLPEVSARRSDLRLLSRQPSGLQMTHLICLRYTLIRMDATELISEIIATYQRHGWELRRVLLRPETRTALAAFWNGGGHITEPSLRACI